MALPTTTLAFLSLLLAVPNGGWLGVYLDDDQPVISEVIPDSPAAKAGLRAKDRILAVGSKRVATRQQLVDSIKTLDEGAKVRLSIQRGTELLAVDVVLGAAPKAAVAPAPPPSGVAVPKVGQAPARPFLGVELQEEDGEVKVVRVLQKSPAEQAGLRGGQTVVQMAGRPVRTIEDMDGILKGIKVGERIPMEVLEAGSTRRLTLVVGSAAMGTGGPLAPKPAVAPKAPEAANVPTPPAPARATAPSPSAGPVSFTADLEAAMATARREVKPLLLVFGASWCTTSAALKKSFQDPAVRAVATGYVPVWIDTDREGRIADDYKVQGIPLIVLRGPGGNTLYRVEGYQPPAILAELLARHRKPAVTAATPVPARDVSPRSEARELESLRQEVRRLKAEVESLRRQLEAAEKAKAGGR